VSPELWLCRVGHVLALWAVLLLPPTIPVPHRLCERCCYQSAWPGKERNEVEAICVLPMPGSHPPPLPLTKGGLASFSLLLYFGQQQRLWYLQTGTPASAKIFVGFRAKSSFKAGLRER